MTHQPFRLVDLPRWFWILLGLPIVALTWETLLPLAAAVLIVSGVLYGGITLAYLLLQLIFNSGRK